MSEYMNPIDQLYDEENTDPITLYNEKGEPVDFEQVAIIPLNERVFAILKPITPVPGLGEDEALVFVVEEIDDEEMLVLVTDDKIIDDVFDVYESLVDDEE